MFQSQFLAKRKRYQRWLNSAINWHYFFFSSRVLSYSHMMPPASAKTYENELTTFWFDESGILCALSKRSLRSLEKQKKNFEFIKEITKNKPVCLLADTSSANPLDRETREYTANELPKAFKAMAIISSTPVGRFIANGFLAINKQSIPVKLFGKEAEAREWLKQFL